MKWEMTLCAVFVLATAAYCGELTPDTNTVALWHFNESAGDTAFDTSANSNHGCIFSAGRVEGKFHNALKFDGVDDYVIVADQDNQTGMKQLTIEAWVWIDGPQKGHTKLIGKIGPSLTSDDSYSLETQSDGRVFFIVSGSEGYSFLYSKNAVPRNQWVYLAAVYNGDSLKLYVNGTQDTSCYLGQVTIRNTAEPILIGMNNTPGDEVYFKGMIDEARISNVARSAAEIEFHYYGCADSIISAEASDGVIKHPGIDNDDYVVIHFIRRIDTTAWKINKNTIDSILFLSNGHSWLSGFGTVGNVEWNAERTQLLITLSTSTGAPSIAVGDSISFNKKGKKIPITGTFELPVAVMPYSPKDRLRVWYNASKASVSVRFPGGNLPPDVRFYLPNGKSVALRSATRPDGFDWNLSDLNAGILLMKVTTPGGTVSKTVYLIK